MLLKIAMLEYRDNLVFTNTHSHTSTWLGLGPCFFSIKLCDPYTLVSSSLECWEIWYLYFCFMRIKLFSINDYLVLPWGPLFLVIWHQPFCHILKVTKLFNIMPSLVLSKNSNLLPTVLGSCIKQCQGVHSLDQNMNGTSRSWVAWFSENNPVWPLVPFFVNWSYVICKH